MSVTTYSKCNSDGTAQPAVRQSDLFSLSTATLHDSKLPHLCTGNYKTGFPLSKMTSNILAKSSNRPLTFIVFPQYQ